MRLTTGGQETVGQFARASESSLTVVVDGQPQDIHADAVREVRRSGSRRGRGMIVGASIGAALGYVEGSPLGGWSYLGAVLGMAPGAVIGGLIPQHTIVYRSMSQTAGAMKPDGNEPVFERPTGTHVIVSPVLGHHAKGVRLSLAF